MITNFCVTCGVPADVSLEYADFCQFHWSCLRHELKIRLDAIRDFGHTRCGSNFGVTFWGPISDQKLTTLWYGLYLANYPHEAMEEAFRLSVRNNWKVLRVDVQGGAERRLGLPTCTNIYVSPEFQKYMKYSGLAALPYDAKRFGEIRL